MKSLCVTLIIGLISISSVSAAENTAKIATENATEKSAGNGKHLFILTGQSNMRRLRLDIDFMPPVNAEFGEDNVIVVKHDSSGEPIKKWDKEWKALGAKKAGGSQGGIYNTLMKKVKEAIEGKKIKTVTFIWMQGEADSGGAGEVYEASLRRVIRNVGVDLGRADINYIIGRLSDFDAGKRHHWSMIRDIHVKIAESSPRGGWVSTDDLNGKGNAIHYTKDGYNKLGKRYVAKARELIDKNSKKVINSDKK